MKKLEELIPLLEKATAEFVEYCHKVPESDFFNQPGPKWSVAQNVVHLTTSANMTKLAFRLPKFILRWYKGKPNRPSRSYNELVAKYKLKLEQGGKAMGPFDVAPVPASKGKDHVVVTFGVSMERLIRVIKKNYNDDNLDKYLAPHPLLGKITLRELIYFTDYHIHHHLLIIRQRLAAHI